MLRENKHPFHCKLTNRVVLIRDTYRKATDLGNNMNEDVFETRECPHYEECAVKNIYQDCPLPGNPWE
jgi:hypothetical protein